MWSKTFKSFKAEGCLNALLESLSNLKEYSAFLNKIGLEGGKVSMILEITNKAADEVDLSAFIACSDLKIQIGIEVFN
jgi:hypothetical protein